MNKIQFIGWPPSVNVEVDLGSDEEFECYLN